MFRSIVLLLSFLVLVLPVAPVQAASSESSIATVVNEEAISVADVAARTKLILVSSGIPDTAEMREKMRPQIIGNLIDERLMMQEAGRAGIVVSQEDIDSGFVSLSRQNNMEPEKFRSILNRQRIPLKTLSDQIASQVAWSEVVQTKVRPRVTITENEIDSFIERIRSDVGKTQYQVSEIYLPVDTPRDEMSVKQLAEKLTRQMKEGRAPFPRVAAQFSQAAGAARGGDRGWIREGELPEELDIVLTKMEEGTLSRPVRSLSGYHILLLRRKSVMDESAVPSREDVHNKLGLEQLDRLQRRLLLDLKSAAFIENRV